MRRYERGKEVSLVRQSGDNVPTRRRITNSNHHGCARVIPSKYLIFHHWNIVNDPLFLKFAIHDESHLPARHTIFDSEPGNFFSVTARAKNSENSLAII